MKGFIIRVSRHYRRVLLQSFSDKEYSYQRYLAAFFGLIGSVISFAMGINSILIDLFGLAISLFATSLLLFLSFLLLMSDKYVRYHNGIKYMALVALLSLGAYLIHSGGVDNSGPLWIYIFPSVIFAFCGFKIGIMINVVFCAILILILYTPDNYFLSTLYPVAFKSRLVLSFSTTVALSAFYEATRHNSYLKMKRLKVKFEQESQIDELTHLPNRRGMRKKLREAYRKAITSNQVFTLAVFDIDHFKNVNDCFGHEIGDEVLKHVSDVLSDGIREQDILSRWGGEEFLLLLPNTNGEEAFPLLEEMRKLIEKSHYHKANEVITITFSIGYCEMSDTVSLSEMIHLADVSLYKAKQTGRNKVLAHG
ncbi:GGDEF domain-containing protein [Marinomonas posidonica]|uniref:diguanylate cyclase n=1 Tax=Marinomonas posidonica (strain CECT 7376 / NCIMB 14433 / IVIA-Po-181) TaxID=491952 RepID=F6CT05_MARPP|nr:GGDEF domain-containing protein [Marinomonas posidonica]AEF55063.1 diguanylate cyclase [Marinomonas posidonica IVIA-Po-181]